MRRGTNSLTIVAGLYGAAGVATAAYAAHHGGGADLPIASQFLLVHAAALLAIALSSAGDDGVFLTAASILALGVGLFSGDLIRRALFDARLFPLAAPAGGLLMIAGWLALSVAGLAMMRRQPKKPSRPPLDKSVE